MTLIEMVIMAQTNEIDPCDWDEINISTDNDYNMD